MEWINRLVSLFYVFFNTVWNQFIVYLFQVICLPLSGHDFHHHLVDLADLLMLGISSLHEHRGGEEKMGKHKVPHNRKSR